jgi:hypothetical protein
MHWAVAGTAAHPAAFLSQIRRSSRVRPGRPSDPEIHRMRAFRPAPLESCNVDGSDRSLDRTRFEAAWTWDEYLGGVERNAALWHAVTRRAEPPDDLVEELRDSVGGPRYLLALTEDWCGDAVNALPWVARLAEAVPQLEFRLLGRDENPDLMDAHLTGTSRSIPVVMVFDEGFNELGWWGPRPGDLQSWAISPEAREMDSDERYKVVRTWYARDRGRTILEEIASLLRLPSGAGT